jgi:uncharacterized protein YlxW (UPF0749 family)
VDTDPTLTDEELARTEKLLEEWLFGDTHVLWLVRRLIATLRAGRAENDRLQADSNRFRAEAERLSRLRVSKESLTHKVKNLEAEVEELKKNQITHEYDEETGYCLCTCCDHGI